MEIELRKQWQGCRRSTVDHDAAVYSDGDPFDGPMGNNALVFDPHNGSAFARYGLGTSQLFVIGAQQQWAIADPDKKAVIIVKRDLQHGLDIAAGLKGRLPRHTQNRDVHCRINFPT
ncbi:hypothetical protein [Blastomonas aquatica]|uniref:Uncharacterized protein n=1 Tax=Blastomonas aquatica TaxID=1510276 RepID=A0ABQ1JMA4_9SPHN|nr:hypothetical protein [Blastomonas aquatica]GGB72671.1 hypothetical protein GCM10010833_29810 [Blastomonas aquatica]